MKNLFYRLPESLRFLILLLGGWWVIYQLLIALLVILLMVFGIPFPENASLLEATWWFPTVAVAIYGASVLAGLHLAVSFTNKRR